MARTHTFKGSASAGYGYAAFVEDGQLVITEDWGRDGGVLYRGPYEHCPSLTLRQLSDKLRNSIVDYYAAKKEEATKEPVTHIFKDSRDLHGNGWYGYIEEGKLVIGHEAPREGGILFRGTYEEAAERGWIATLLREDYNLYDDIQKYFSKHGGLTMNTKAKIIVELVCSLNAGDSGYIDDRVHHAIEQYNKLVKTGIIKEEDN